MQRRGRGKKRPIVRDAANHRIETLYSLSISTAIKGDLTLARRYLKLARGIGMRYTVRIPPDMKRMTCNGCMTPLIPGLTARNRTRNGNTIITCLECGKIKRYRIKRSDQDEKV